jgi:hypothetical protein
MRDAGLPAVLLCLAYGLAAGSGGRTLWRTGVGALSSTAIAVVLASPPHGWLDVAFLGCWASVLLCAISVLVGVRAGAAAALALSVNAGLWCGAVIATAGSPRNLCTALPCTLTVLLAGGGGASTRIGDKIAASWLGAVALLAAALQFLPATRATRLTILSSRSFAMRRQRDSRRARPPWRVLGLALLASSPVGAHDFWLQPDPRATAGSPNHSCTSGRSRSGGGVVRRHP